MNCCKNVVTKIILLVKIKLSLNIELNFIEKVTFQKIFQLKSNPTNKNLKLKSTNEVYIYLFSSIIIKYTKI